MTCGWGSRRRSPTWWRPPGWGVGRATVWSSRTPRPGYARPGRPECATWWASPADRRTWMRSSATSGPSGSRARRSRWTTEAGSRPAGRRCQGPELIDQPGKPFTELHLGEEDADRPVRVDEEVGALAARPSVPAGVRPVRHHSHAEPPARRVPEAGEEAV